MVKDLFRTFGAACILTGVALYFLSDGGDTMNGAPKESELQQQITYLQDELDKTEEELAKIQQATSVAQKSEAENDKKLTNAALDRPEMKTTLKIEQGANSTSVANELVRLKVIQDAGAFESYLKQHHLSGKIQIGEYEVNDAMSIESIAKTITSAK